MGHHLELSFKDTVEKTPIQKRLKDLLLGLFMLYHHSPLNHANPFAKQTCKSQRSAQVTTVSSHSEDISPVW